MSALIRGPRAWSLAGARCIVTGGTKGIGKETAREFLSHGADVIVCGRTEADVVAVVAELTAESETTAAAGGAAVSASSIAGVACDVSTAEGRATLLAFAAARWRPIAAAADHAAEGAPAAATFAFDVLVNNVGTNQREPIERQSAGQYVGPGCLNLHPVAL